MEGWLNCRAGRVGWWIPLGFVFLTITRLLSFLFYVNTSTLKMQFSVVKSGTTTCFEGNNNIVILRIRLPNMALQMTHDSQTLRMLYVSETRSSTGDTLEWRRRESCILLIAGVSYISLYTKDPTGEVINRATFSRRLSATASRACATARWTDGCCSVCRVRRSSNRRQLQV